MPPVRAYSNWNQRSTDTRESIEPYRHYYFICEGRNTEKFYFEKLFDLMQAKYLHSQIKIVYLEKTDEDENISTPRELIKLADKQKSNGSITYDPKFDKMFVVFDADVFKDKPDKYKETVELGLKRNFLGITNPSFELFLLLHYKNSVNDLIIPDTSNILNNAWVGRGQNRKRYIEDVFRKKSGMRPKSNSNICKLANDVHIAIAQEKKINNDINLCLGNITSNIGQIIESIENELKVKP